MFCNCFLVLVIFGIPSVTTQLTADCDVELANVSTDVLHSVPKPKLRTIQAILASCNKSILQKLTEISIHLLDKGTIESREMEDVRELEKELRLEKAKHWTEILAKLEGELLEVGTELAVVAQNASLSGNEKVATSTRALLQLTPENHQKLMRIIGKTNPKKNISSPFNGVPIEAVTQIAISSTTITPTSRSFAIGQGVTPKQPKDDGKERLLISSFKVRPSSDLHFLPSVEKNVISVHATETAAHNESHQNNNLFSQINRPKPNPMRSEGKSILGNPVKPLVTSNGRPVTVGATKLEMKENLDLLAPKTSLWKEAAQLLQAPLVQSLMHQIPHGVATPNRGLVPSNTFPLPRAAYQIQGQTTIVRPALSKRSYLPARDDPEPATSRADLAGYRTDLGRFETGKSNKIVLSSATLQHIHGVPTYGGPTQQQQMGPLPQPPGVTTTTQLPTTLKTLPEGVVRFPESNKVENPVPQPNSRGLTDAPLTRYEVTYPPIPAPTNTKQPTIIDLNNTEKESHPVLSNSPSGISQPSAQPYVPYYGPETLTGSDRRIVDENQRGRRVKIDLFNE